MARSKLTITDRGLNRLKKMSEELARKPYVKVGVLAGGAVSVKRVKARPARQKKNKRGEVVGILAARQASTTVTSPTISRAGGEIDNVALAVIHEFGVPQKNIPSRPFLRSTFDAKKTEWNALLSRMALGVLRGKLTVEQALGLLGQRASADVKLRITTGNNFVPNAPRTIAAKGSSRPLIDTGRLVNSISYQVVTP